MAVSEKLQKTDTREQDRKWHIAQTDRRFKNVQGSNRSKDTEIELIVKNSDKKWKYLMWNNINVAK